MEDSRLLGPVIKAWFKSNDWPQSTSEGLARAKGWEAGPWASQISICMAGKLAPKPPFFVAMGMFNEAVAERDFAGVTDRRLMDRLIAGQPVCHDSGVPWTATDFFGCYIGVLKPPKDLFTTEIRLTQDEVDYYISELRSGFRELVLQLMDPKGPPAVWQRVAKAGQELGLHGDDIEFFQEICCGLRETVTVDEAARMMRRYPSCPIVSALISQFPDVGKAEIVERLLQLAHG